YPHRRRPRLRHPAGPLDHHRNPGDVRDPDQWRLAACHRAQPAADLRGPTVLRPPRPALRATALHVTGIEGFPSPGVLAWPGVAGDELAFLLGFRPSRLGGAFLLATRRSVAPGQRRQLRGVLR